MGTTFFRPQNGLVFLRVLIWGPTGHTREARLVLDTGTARTMLAEPMAHALGLTPDRAVRRSRVSSVVGPELGYMVPVRRIRALGWERLDFAVACHRFAEGCNMDGLLGADFFAGLRLIIDYAVGRVDLIRIPSDDPTDRS